MGRVVKCGRKKVRRIGKAKFTKKRTNLTDNAVDITTHNMSMKSEPVAEEENLLKVSIFKSLKSLS